MYSRPILFIGVDRLAYCPRMLSPNEGKTSQFFSSKYDVDKFLGIFTLYKKGLLK